MKTRLHSTPALLATLVLAACSTAPTMPEKAWKVSPVQTVRHGDGVRADGYFALGRVREGQGAYVKAMEAYRKAIEADPAYAPAWNALGVLQMQQGAREEGIHSIEQAVRLSPSASHLYNNLGYALLLAKRHDTAAAALQRAVELDPANRRAWRNLASLWQALGNAEQAALAEAKATGTLPPAAIARGSAETEQIKAPATAPLAGIAPAVTPPANSPIATSYPVAEALTSPAPEARGAVAVEQAAPAAAPIVQTAPEVELLKVAENVFELRNGPVTRTEAIAEAANIIRTTTQAPAVITEAKADESATRLTRVVDGSPPVRTEPVEGPGSAGLRQAQPERHLLAGSIAAAPPARVARYEITNGQGGEGLARRLAAMLGKDGFKRPRLTNHPDFNQAVSYVEYREGYREQATAFAALLPFRPTLRPAESSLLVDVRLMLGKDLNTAEACEALGVCATYARSAPPTQTQTAGRDAALTPVSDGAAQRKRPPPDRI